MNERDQRRLEALERRQQHLNERLERWKFGDPHRTRAEESAIHWAITVILGADEKDMIAELAKAGEKLLREK